MKRPRRLCEMEAERCWGEGAVMRLKTIDGKIVVDAKKPLMLHITAADITNADRKEPHACVVARACRRELHVKEVRVHLSRIYVRTNDSNWTRYHTPASLRSEIIAFDRGGEFSKGEHRLVPLQPAKRLGADKRKRSKRNRKPEKKREYRVVKDVRGGPA